MCRCAPHAQTLEENVMTLNAKTAKLFWWPALFAGLCLATGDDSVSALVVLAMAFHDEISTAMRRRRISFEGLGVHCTLDSASDHAAPAR